jgi:hypothetical protein
VNRFRRAATTCYSRYDIPHKSTTMYVVISICVRILLFFAHTSEPLIITKILYTFGGWLGANISVLATFVFPPNQKQVVSPLLGPNHSPPVVHGRKSHRSTNAARRTRPCTLYAAIRRRARPTSIRSVRVLHPVRVRRPRHASIELCVVI